MVVVAVHLSEVMALEACQELGEDVVDRDNPYCPKTRTGSRGVAMVLSEENHPAQTFRLD